MERDRCKANLKKLRLPGVKSTEETSSSIRKVRSTNAAISKYFNTPVNKEIDYQMHKERKKANEINVNKGDSPITNNSDFVQEQKLSDDATTVEKLISYKSTYKGSLLNKKCRKPTKLKDFVLTEGTFITQNDNRDESILHQAVDWTHCKEVPLKKVKKITKLQRNRSSSTVNKSRFKNHQPDIKSSLMRRERIFSEITAQHCRVDNFSADEIELALALSKSEVETSGINEGIAFQQAINENKEYNNLKDINNILQQYGFRTVQEGYNNFKPTFLPCSIRRAKAKWTYRFTPLTLREPQLQRKKINLRIDSLMDKQIVCKYVRTSQDNSATYSLISSDLCKLNATKNLLRKLESEKLIDLECYYVKDLFELAHVQTGYLLKDWHAIQGRDRSPEIDNQSQTKWIELSKQVDQHETHMIENNKWNLKHKKKSRIDKGLFATLATESVCSLLTAYDLQESFNVTEDNSEKIESANNQSTDNSIGDVLLNRNNTFDSNELKLSSCKAKELILNSCSNVNNTRTRSPNIFASSEDESDETIRTIMVFGDHHPELYHNIEDVSKNNEKPVISHVPDLTRNAFLERSNMYKDENLSVFKGDEQNETPNVKAYSRSEAQWPLLNYFKCTWDASVTKKGNTSEHTLNILQGNFYEGCLKAPGKEIKTKDLRTENSLLNETPDSSVIPTMDINLLNSQSLMKEENKSIALYRVGRSQTFTKAPNEAHQQSPMIRSESVSVANIPEKGTNFKFFNSFQYEESGTCFDDCLILSENEVNYSIRKADISRSKACSNSHETKSEIKNRLSFSANMNKFSIPELIEGESIFENNTDESDDSNKSSYKCEAIQKAPNVSPTLRTDRSVEWMEFRILDDISDQTSQIFKIPSNHIKSSKPSISMQITPFGFDRLITGYMSLNNSKKKVDVTETCPPQLQKFQLFEFSPHEYKIDGRMYMTRIITDPKPDFKQQTEEEILKQLYGFGIKPIKRKQAVKILEHIYNSTHPLILEKDTCMRMKLKVDTPSSILIDDEFNTDLTQLSSCISSSSNKLKLMDCLGTDMLRSIKELQTDFENEEYVFQTNVTKKTPRPLLPLHIAWYNLVSSTAILHEEILMYKPINLHEIYVFFKKLGYRFEPKDMKIFLDNRCIIFRYDMTRPARVSERHIRKN